MFDELRRRLGIEEPANCSTCAHLGTEDDGNYPEFAISWPACMHIERYQYLKSFPFKKEMPCYHPGFWYSKFADLIKTGEDYEYNNAVRCYLAVIDALPSECKHMWE
jgi:hypothetical protein